MQLAYPIKSCRLCCSPAGNGTCNGTDSTFFSLSKSTVLTGDGTVQGNGSFLVPSGSFLGSGESLSALEHLCIVDDVF